MGRHWITNEGLTMKNLLSISLIFLTTIAFARTVPVRKAIKTTYENDAFVVYWHDDEGKEFNQEITYEEYTNLGKKGAGKPSVVPADIPDRNWAAFAHPTFQTDDGKILKKNPEIGDIVQDRDGSWFVKISTDPADQQEIALPDVSAIPKEAIAFTTSTARADIAILGGNLVVTKKAEVIEAIEP